MARTTRYSPTFTDVAVAFFVGLPKRRQRKLLDCAHQLAADPFLAPDFATRDSDGREIAHILIEGFIFDYWIDHPAHHIVIASIDDAR